MLIINIVHMYCTWFDRCPATRWHDDSPTVAISKLLGDGCKKAPVMFVG